MGMEMLGADITPKQVEVNEGSANFLAELDGKSLSNLAQELAEPTKALSVDSLNGTKGKVTEADNLTSSNVPMDAVDEWPAPKQTHTFHFVKVRLYEDPQLKEKINVAEEDLKKQNSKRVGIIDRLKLKRDNRSKLKKDLQPYLNDNRKYRDTINAARESGMGLCASEELNELIKSLQYRIQHESNTLNEEKQLIKEIKQLEATRSKVVANVPKKEIENTEGQKAADQDKIKLLSVNVDEVWKERQAVLVQIKQLDEQVKGIDYDIAMLEEELRTVTEKRDKAYETVLSLRKARAELNACFYQNRNLLNNARFLAGKKDLAGLESLCNNEVETFMSEWNSSKAFRRDYERGILASLNNRQLSRDGRMRNPDERPIVVETPPATKSTTSSLGVTPKQEEAVKLPSSDGSNKKQGEDILKAKADSGKKVSNTNEMEKAHEEEQPHNSFKSEEIDPAKLKEVKREEEIAKAKLAMERKKKLAEKAAAKAALKAQKEAEKKLKQKEKKAKKKAGTNEPASFAEQTEMEMKPAEAEETDVNLDKPVLEQKVNLRVREKKPKVQNQLPRVILKRKKSRSYVYWAAGAAILALVLVVVGYYSFGRI